MNSGPRWLLALTSIAALSSCDGPGNETVLRVADAIYFNGDILTVDAENTIAAAVAVGDGRILAVGDADEVLRHEGDGTRMIDLAGRALLPGFIDSHSHLAMTAAKLATADLSPAPAGTIESLDDIESALRTQIAEADPAPDEWVVGWGYDHSMLVENRHPTRDDLDRVSTEHAIVAMHFSGHMAVLNSNGLERVGYDADTPDPVGGVIRRRQSGREPNGIIEEQAWLPVWRQVLNPTFEQKLELTAIALQVYASQGFTTVQDGATTDPDIEHLFEELTGRGQVPLDVIAFPFQPFLDQFTDVFDDRAAYHDRLKFGGVKIVLDGGSPGRTAYLREPYFVQLEGDERYRGYPHFPEQATIDELVARLYGENIPVNIHALGDAAIDQAIAAVRHAEQAWPAGDRRTKLIHLQFLQQDQLEQLEELDVTLTFQVTHNYYFGDLHREWTVGPERAAGLNPAQSALDSGLSVTIHHDSPVHPVDQLMLIWAAVNRVTRSGEVLGPAERIAVEDALRASTIEAAYQHFEEADKGSIEAGKLADFVILSASPYEAEPIAIKDLEVIETIKEGRTIYRRAD